MVVGGLRFECGWWLCEEEGKVFLPFLEPYRRTTPRDPELHVEVSHTQQEALSGSLGLGSKR